MAQVLILEFNYLNEDILWCNRKSTGLGGLISLVSNPDSTIDCVALAGTLNFFEP